MQNKILELTERNFNQVVQSTPGVTVVDFWANWCAPCRMLSPVFQELADIYGAEIMFCKVNSESAPLKMAELGIKSLPTLIFYKGGVEADRIVGLPSKARLAFLLEQYLADQP